MQHTLAWRGAASAPSPLCFMVIPLHLLIESAPPGGNWLTKYGYLPPSDPSTGQLQAWTAVTRALRTMQKFAGLKDTGVLDEETAALMRTPRCSLPDDEEELLVHEEGKDARRRRRSAVSMWTRRNINWRVQSYPSSSHLSREMVRSLVFYALRVWADPTPLEFHEVGSPESADLQVDFLHGYHGDNYPFDGAGGAVGHAFFPSDPARAGGVHLDSEEQWAFRQPDSEGTDLFTVLVHEFGHALGLTHSSSRHSVMRPYYQGPAGDPLHYRLGHQDLEYITQLYGQIPLKTYYDTAPQEPPSSSSQTRVRPTKNKCFPSMDRCNTSFDAVAKIRGETFFFKGLTMWRVNSGGLVSRRGSSVRKLWRGLPADLPQLEAVIERPSDHAIIFISAENMFIFSTSPGSIYIFKGDSYWKFLFPGSAPLQGYPRSSAADWLDCADALPLPSVGDISLSSPPGRQELREQDSAPYSWTQCTCQSGALSHGGRTLTCVYILITWILLTL
uniref:Matrix metallopeptidase 17b n=1 Tax=Oryzias melastigma TaxID=30732 RepID=A0A3B3CLJ9_ORYME